MTRNVVKMLIIDDDIENRRLLKRGLSKKDYRVVEAETGDAGLDLLRSKQPDIVILELVLPDIDGIEVISLIRAHSKVPVIVLSSCGDERTKIKALLSGADDYVTKPFSMDEFVARCRPGSAMLSISKGRSKFFALES
jgi:two-component system, OmpR family, KDP operon response regulator KdpE